MFLLLFTIIELWTIGPIFINIFVNLTYFNVNKEVVQTNLSNYTVLEYLSEIIIIF